MILSRKPKELHDEKVEIVSIPFVITEVDAMTVTREFDVDSFTGDSSLYKVLLCVMCNLCIAHGLNLYVYPRTQESTRDSPPAIGVPSLTSQLRSLTPMGFTMDRSNPFVSRADSEFGVGDPTGVAEDIAFVFYSKGKMPFTRDDMDPRLFPVFDADFRSGGGLAESGGGLAESSGGLAESSGHKGVQGGSAAMGIFGLLVTVAASALGSRSARPR